MAIEISDFLFSSKSCGVILFCFEKHKSIDDGYFRFDGVFGHFETREGDVGGVEYGSWKVRKGGLGGKPSAISFGKIIVRS